MKTSSDEVSHLLSTTEVLLITLTPSVFQDVHIGFLGEFCFWPEAIISNHWPWLLKEILPRRWQEWHWGRLPWWRSSLKSCRDMCLARGAGVIFLISIHAFYSGSRELRAAWLAKQGQPSSANRFISQSKSQGVKLSSPATVSDIIHHSSGSPPRTSTIICWPEVHEVINSILKGNNNYWDVRGVVRTAARISAK